MIYYELPKMKYSEQKGLVSIIVPIYNTDEIFLRGCLNSVLAQTFTNWEAILVDDGSADSTGKIVDEYAEKDSRFIVIHKQNEGTLLARKTGLENSKGEFIANLDHDDRYHPQFLEKMHAKIKETNADFIWCKSQVDEDEFNVYYHVTDYEWNEDKSKNIEIMLTRAQGVSWHTWDKLIKRKIYIQVNFPNMNFILGEDPIQILQVAYNSNSAVFISENLYFHKKGGASARENAISVIQTVVVIDDILKKIFNGIVPEKIKNIFFSTICMNGKGIAYYYFLLDKNKREEFRNKLNPFLSKVIKYEKKINLKICLLLANIGIEFPFKFREWVRKNIWSIKGVQNELKLPLVIYYRISDVGYAKTKPPYINNENCLRNAVKYFSIENCRWVIIADNCSNETMQMIKKYIPEHSIHAVSIGHGAGTFRLAYKMALELDDNTPIYFLENDYLHKPGSYEVLLDGLSLFYSYVTLYDHPDKYDNAHFAVKNGGEKTRVLIGKCSHWKITHSTTMTFASTVKTLKQDWAIFDRWTQTKHPYDCQIFMELACKNHRLISPLPSFSTHGETTFLAPLVEWNKIALESCV